MNQRLDNGEEKISKPKDRAVETKINTEKDNYEQSNTELRDNSNACT